MATGREERAAPMPESGEQGHTQTAAVPTEPSDGLSSLDLTGRVLAGKFKVLRKLGQGGMGQVYLAEQVSLKRSVALKVLRPELAASPPALARFRAEAEAVARA